MDANADMIRVRATRSGDFTDADPLLAAMSATLPKGDDLLDPQKMAAASGFPLHTRMTLAITPHRIVVYKNGWGNKVGSLLGEVPLHRLNNIEITWNRKLAVVAIDLHDAPPVVMRAVDPEAAEHLRNEFLKVRGRI